MIFCISYQVDYSTIQQSLQHVAMRWASASADKKAFNDPIISKSWEKFCPNNFSTIELQARNMDYGIFIPCVPELQTLYRLAIFNGNNSDSSGGPTSGEQAAGWYILLYNYVTINAMWENLLPVCSFEVDLWHIGCARCSELDVLVSSWEWILED